METFIMACDIIEKKLPLIILLGGTSGIIILFILKEVEKVHCRVLWLQNLVSQQLLVLIV